MLCENEFVALAAQLGWVRVVGGWGDPGWEEGMEADDPGVPWGGMGESEDQFAARIWAHMQRRKNAGAEAAAK